MTRENACSYRKISRPKLNTAARSTVENHVALFTVDVTCRLIYDSCAIDCTYIIVSFFCRQNNLVIEHTLFSSSPLKSDASSVGLSLRFGFSRDVSTKSWKLCHRRDAWQNLNLQCKGCYLQLRYIIDSVLCMRAINNTSVLVGCMRS